jgi:hypothetical protein
MAVVVVLAEEAAVAEEVALVALAAVLAAVT